MAAERSKKPAPAAKAATPYHHGDLRPALVKAALAILEETGLSALSLRETARRVGVSHAAPYHHFADLDALADAVAAEGFRLQKAAMESARGVVPTSGLDALRAYGAVYADFATRHPALFRLMYTRERVREDRESELAQAGADAFRILVDGICQASGCPHDRAKSIALLLWSSMHGLALLWLDGQLAWTGETEISPLAAALADTLALVLPAPEA